MTEDYDYIICGAGASGLWLAYWMSQSDVLTDKKMLLIDREVKNTNDRTWCFWLDKDEEAAFLRSTVCKTWQKGLFASENHTDTFFFDPYEYHQIRSSDFYTEVFGVLDQDANFTYLQEDVIAIDQKEGFGLVTTTKGQYKSPLVCTSILDPLLLEQQNQYVYLKQHFVGWFIKTDTAVFDPEVATFMDFTVAQKGNTRFMYVLPTSATEALIEYTLFSDALLNRKEYEDEIEKYLGTIGVTYQITETEQGNIPMTCYPFWKHNSENIVHIGSAGGWTKPSTGFTFMNSYRNAKELVARLEQKSALTIVKKNRFWWYDLVFLDVLDRRNELGASLFSKMFQKNTPKVIFDFLDDQSTPTQELKIISSFPPLEFIKSAIRLLFKL